MASPVADHVLSLWGWKRPCLCALAVSHSGQTCTKMPDQHCASAGLGCVPTALGRNNNQEWGRVNSSSPGCQATTCRTYRVFHQHGADSALSFLVISTRAQLSAPPWCLRAAHLQGAVAEPACCHQPLVGQPAAAWSHLQPPLFFCTHSPKGDHHRLSPPFPPSQGWDELPTSLPPTCPWVSHWDRSVCGGSGGFILPQRSCTKQQAPGVTNNCAFTQRVEHELTRWGVSDNIDLEQGLVSTGHSQA